MLCGKNNLQGRSWGPLGRIIINVVCTLWLTANSFLLLMLHISVLSTSVISLEYSSKASIIHIWRLTEDTTTRGQGFKIIPLLLHHFIEGGGALHNSSPTTSQMWCQWCWDRATEGWSILSSWFHHGTYITHSCITVLKGSHSYLWNDDKLVWMLRQGK